MSKQASNPKGTRDFLPSELSKRNYILDILKKNDIEKYIIKNKGLV